MASFIFHRKPAPFAIFRKLTILIDGEPRAALRQREVKTVDVPPGRYTLQARMDWCSSPEIALELKSEQAVHVECGYGGFFRSAAATFLSPRAALFIAPREETTSR